MFVLDRKCEMKVTCCFTDVFVCFCFVVRTYLFIDIFAESRTRTDISSNQIMIRMGLDVSSFV